LKFKRGLIERCAICAKFKLRHEILKRKRNENRANFKNLKLSAKNFAISNFINLQSSAEFKF